MIARGDGRERIIALRIAKAHSEVVDYRTLLPKLPRLKDHILRRTSAEQDPTLKGRLVMCVGKLKGADVLKILFGQLDDKRLLDRHGGPSTLRICDYAFNIIYRRVAQLPSLAWITARRCLTPSHEIFPWNGGRLALRNLRKG